MLNARANLQLPAVLVGGFTGVFASRFTRRFAGVFASGFTSKIAAFVKRRAVSANAVCLYAHSHTVKFNPPESDRSQTEC